MNNLIAKVFAKKPGMPKGGQYYVFQCLYCQKPFVAPGYEVNAGRMTKYCSNECQQFAPGRMKNAREALKIIPCSGKDNHNYKDGATLYTKYRKESCELCGKSENRGKKKRMLVHHCDMNRRNSEPSNLRTVCFSCHMRIHNPSNYGKFPDFQRW